MREFRVVEEVLTSDTNEVKTKIHLEIKKYWKIFKWFSRWKRFRCFIVQKDKNGNLFVAKANKDYYIERAEFAHLMCDIFNNIGGMYRYKGKTITLSYNVTIDDYSFIIISDDRLSLLKYNGRFSIYDCDIYESSEQCERYIDSFTYKSSKKVLLGRKQKLKNILQ